MLSPTGLAAALDGIGPSLRRAVHQRAAEVAAATAALGDLATLSADRVHALLRETASPGARPTADHDRHSAQ